MSRLLLCCDLDRTLIPNGAQPEHPAARPCFCAFCRRPEVLLVYVTGRHRQLVEQAIAEYQLPMPDFAITDVGTRISQVAQGDWQPLPGWEEEIAIDWRGKSHAELKALLESRRELQLQEEAKQNRFKLSYYLSLEADKDAVIAWVAEHLQKQQVAASLVWSVDEPAGIGLLDVLPRNATKLHGIEYLRQQLGFSTTELLFAGDSGNDLAVLGSAIPAVLVANASAEVRAQARREAEANGHPEALYLAVEQGFPLGGNYAAGILQGVWHFQPKLQPLLLATGFWT